MRADIAQNKLSTKRGQPPVAASPFHLLLYPISAICQAPQNNPNPFTFCKTMHTSAKRAQIVNKCPPCALSRLKVFPFFSAYLCCNAHIRKKNTEYRIQSAFFRVLRAPGRGTKTSLKVPKIRCFSWKSQRFGKCKSFLIIFYEFFCKSPAKTP